MTTFLLSFFLLPLLLQDGQSNSNQMSKTGEVQGTLVEGSSENPIAKALVILSKGKEDNIGSYTDAAGNFAFHSLDPGTYLISAEHNGFVADAKSQPQPVVVSAGKASDSITLHLNRTGAVSGRIEIGGEPVTGASVQIMPLKQNKQRPQVVNYGVTDDRGYYRAYNIPPGRYKLAVTYTPRQGQPPLKIQNDKNNSKDVSSVSYGTTYYGGSLDPSQATIIQVEPGSDVQGIDIALLQTKTVRVRGHVMDADGGSQTPLVVVILTPITGGGSANEMQVRPDGSFEFSQVAPGKYAIEAIAMLQHGRQLATSQFEVGESDLDGLQLTLGRLQTVTGAVMMPVKRKLPSGMLLMLSSRQPSPEFGNQGGGFAQVNENGAFSIENVAPGDYDLALGNTRNGDDLYVAAIRSGDQDVLASGLHVGTSAPPPLEVILKANGAQIDCAVVNEKQKPAPETVVMLVPDAPRQWEAALRAECQTDASGKCSLLGVAPGDYHAFALRKGESADVHDPDTMAAIAKLGNTITVTQNDKKSLRVDLLPLDTSDN